MRVFKFIAVVLIAILGSVAYFRWNIERTRSEAIATAKEIQQQCVTERACPLELEGWSKDHPDDSYMRNGVMVYTVKNDEEKIREAIKQNKPIPLASSFSLSTYLGPDTGIISEGGVDVELFIYEVWDHQCVPLGVPSTEENLTECPPPR